MPAWKASPGPDCGRPRAREGERNDRQAEQGRCGDSERDGGLPAGDPDGDCQGERHPRGRLGEQQRPVETEPPAAGQKAPGEEARREREDGGDQDPVERLASGQEAVLQRSAKGERRHGESARQGELNRRRDPERLADRPLACLALGDRAREQLLDRPKQDRDRHEDRRPQDDHLAVVHLVEDVGGEREVDVGEQARRADPDREQSGRAPEALRLRRRYLARHGSWTLSAWTETTPGSGAVRWGRGVQFVD